MNRTKTELNEYKSLVGSEIGHSEWITISQKMIDDFCDVTGDYQFIHNDPKPSSIRNTLWWFNCTWVFNAFTNYKNVQRHYPIIAGHELVINYGLNRVRFLAPVPSGSRIRGRITLGKVEPRGENKILTENKIIVEIEDSEKPAMLGTWVTLLIKDEI